MNPMAMTGLARTMGAARAMRITETDTNYFVILFDPETDGFSHICVIEIFEQGGATPPNSHSRAHEFFYVLSGEGRAELEGQEQNIAKGDALLLPPGVEHVIENTGPGKLYTLTVMFPNEGFAELIRGGIPVELDEEDMKILTDMRSGE
ncbi:MAG: cupin domain-containing protein [Novosphingobium sp.]